MALRQCQARAQRSRRKENLTRDAEDAEESQRGVGNAQNRPRPLGTREGKHSLARLHPRTGCLAKTIRQQDSLPTRRACSFSTGRKRVCISRTEMREDWVPILRVNTI